MGSASQRRTDSSSTSGEVYSGTDFDFTYPFHAFTGGWQMPGSIVASLLTHDLSPDFPVRGKGRVLASPLLIFSLVQRTWREIGS